MTAPKKEDDNQAQLRKFMEAARELQTDDSEEAFDLALKKVAKRSSEPLPTKRESRK